MQKPVEAWSAAVEAATAGKDTDMAMAQDNEQAQWHVMRAYKSERAAEERLCDDKYGLKHFIPKQEVIRTVNGRKRVCMVPVIHSLVFVYASHRQIVEFKRNFYNELQFVTWERDGELTYLTVPGRQMDSFIAVCRQKEREVRFYRPGEIGMSNELVKGKRVRVHGGPFDQVEGYFMKVEKRRGRQLVVIIPDLLVAAAEVEPEYIQIID
ncbi:MAG: UpxY family transcription antiterminator [Bacteroidales bacterium]|nr:UpxY family transcription antiterminator [Bacteroidales bacterium]